MVTTYIPFLLKLLDKNFSLINHDAFTKMAIFTLQNCDIIAEILPRVAIA